MSSPVIFVPDEHADLEPEAPEEGAPWGPVPGLDSGPVLLDPNNRALYSRGIIKRRKAPITGYIGLNGHGKSFAMIRDTLPTLAEGGKVLSTVTLLDPHTGNDHPQFVRLHSWRQLLDWRDGDLLLDEVTGIADARDQGMPKHIRRHIAQFRRSRVKVRWTGVDFDNVDRRFRQITQAIVRCRGHWPVRGASDTELWAPNRMFVLTTFDAGTLSSSEDSAMITEESQKRRKARVLNREYVWPWLTPPAFGCYNTMDAVSWVDNSCQHCGGKITDKICRSHGEH